LLTLELDGGEWPTSRPSRFIPKEKTPGTRWIGGWKYSSYLLFYFKILHFKLMMKQFSATLGSQIFNRKK
jgi:hypothetical protein